MFDAPSIPAESTGDATSKRDIRRRRIRFVVTAAAVACAATLLYRFDPTSQVGVHYFPKCWFHQCTGLYCPGCGSTRAFHALLHGHLLTATHFNPVVTLLFVPIVGWSFLRNGIEAVFPDVQFKKRQYPRLALAIAGAVIVFTVLRNLPYQPFCYLAPPVAVAR